MLNQHKILRVLQLITYLQEAPHKSVQQLSTFLDTTERTVYRYLDLLRECGFDLHKDAGQRFFIEKEGVDGVHFSQEEAQFLKELVLSTGKKSKLKDAVLSKIYMGSELPMVASHLLNAKNGKIVERLTKAMMNKEQVVLKKYQSINTETISDRIVEPFGFTENYQTVMAYEQSSEKNKTYNIDRIGSVEYLDLPFKNEDKHEQQIPDVFGFAYAGQKFPVKLELSLKQFLLLKDQYPLVVPFVKYNSTLDKYVLEVEVNDLRVVENLQPSS
jgi:predicted DNA-binding transcriptional regulator YafY